MGKVSAITARDIMGLLTTKHANDVFVPECKNGPTHAASHLRMDAWAMARSWAHPRIVAYEIKVSRSDFVRDDKWRGYLPYCNELYFVCPPKMIALEELPADVGLMVPSANCTRVYTKRKAAYRDITIDEDVLRYVLICRAKIVRDTAYTHDDQTAYWGEWLARRKYTTDLGHRVSRALCKVISEKIVEVNTENQRLMGENATLQDTRDLLQQLGFDGRVPSTWGVQRRVKQLQQTVPPGLENALHNAQRAITAMREALTELAADGKD